jgi:hypothetical protein
MDLAFANIAGTLGLAAGVVAALATVAGGFVAWRTHREDVVRQRINDVREALLNLIDVRERYMALPRNAPNYGITSSFLNQRRAIYLAVAGTLAERVKGALSSDDYATLGLECMAALEYPRALECFERGERRARSGSPLGHAIALRFLAGYYGSDAPDGSLQRADDLFGQAVAKTEGSNDPYMIYQTGLAYQYWAFGTAARRGGLAQDKVDKARELFTRLPASNPLGSQALADLDEAERMAAVGAPTQFQPTSSVSGGLTASAWSTKDGALPTVAERLATQTVSPQIQDPSKPG